MKVKSIFLSMLAIAALVSCSKEEENISPPVPQGEKMVVELTIGGAALSTKAAGEATNDNDKTITDLTVFGVNTTTDAIITKKYFSAPTSDGSNGNKKVVFETTDQTTEIHVIANLGQDLTGSGKALNVNTLKALKNAKTSLIVTSSGAAPAQTEGNVVMSGSTTTVTPGVSGANATASVSLNFIASKIILKSLSRAASSVGDYGTDFKFENALLTNVQTSAYYVRDNSSYIGAISTDIRPAIAESWATGRSGQSDTEVTDFNQSLSSITTFAPGDAATQNIAYWYVFENSNATKHTTLLIEYLWKETQSGAMDKKMYFPVTFMTGDANKIEPGKAYNVSMTFKGNFKPKDDGGGGGGGGTTDPDTPIVPGSVDVTVTPATWTTATTDKEF